MEKYHQGVHGRAGLRPFKAAFSWQLYKVTPLTEHDNPNAVCETGLNEEVEGLAGTLFNEIANLDNEIWQKVYAGKDTVTHKALSPLKTLHQKLCGLTFVEPHVAPVAQPHPDGHQQHHRQGQHHRKGTHPFAGRCLHVP